MLNRFFLAATAAIFLFMPTISRADSIEVMDQFVYTEVGPLNRILTFTWQLPASPIRDDRRTAPGIIGWTSMNVFIEGPLTGNSQLDYGLNRLDGMDLYFYAPNWFGLTCNGGCGQYTGGVFNTPLYTGTFENPTFLLGTFYSTSGSVGKLTITRVPEGSELEMIGITFLGIFGAMFFGRRMRKGQDIPALSPL